MSLKATRPQVTTTATRLDSAAVAPYTGGSIMIKNPASATDSVFIGGATVTTADGFELEPGSTVVIAAESWSRVYALTATSTVQVHLLESRA